MPMSPRLLRPRASGSFDPRAIGNLGLWLDALDGSTLFQDTAATTPATAASDPIGYWGDKSGNGHHATQGTANNRPIRSVSGSFVRVSFDGTNDLLQNFSLPVLGTGSLSVFVVCSTSSTTGFRTVFQVGRGTSSATFVNTGDALLISQDGANNDGTPQVGRVGGDFLLASAPSFTSSLRVFTGIRSSSTVFSAWIDGTPTTPATGDPSAMNIALPGFQVGAATATTFGTIQFWNGLVAEVLIYRAALSDAQRNSVHRYLAGKWGLTVV